MNSCLATPQSPGFLLLGYTEFVLYAIFMLYMGIAKFAWGGLNS